MSCLNGKPSSPDKWMARRLSTAIGKAPLRISLWDGFHFCPEGANPLGAVIIKDRPTLLKLLFEPELGFGDGYTAGRIEVEGDLLEILCAVYRATAKPLSSRWIPALLGRWMDQRQANSLRGSCKNIHHHYDLGNDFYRLWLDPRLVYTCAYFEDGNASLEEAQIAKMNHVCRKLQLKPGDKVVEAGCGWGALALHMAREYGATVKAFNISREQIVYARRQAEQDGLSSQVEFIEDDYRNITGRFDAFVSVGMLEHVGLKHYRNLGGVIHSCLSDHGRGFLHFIGRNRPQRLSAWTRKRIFPGAYTPALRQAMDCFEDWDFSILDIENLRLHYALTLRHWLARFEKSRGRIEAAFGPEFVRAWRLYLTGSIAAFQTGTMQLFQVTFARGADNSIPMTRAHLYGLAAEEREIRCTPVMS
jgi:cyclopropane-fatty-acyl-phospholipid synthase